MNDKAQERDSFEFGGDPYEITITIRGQSRKYYLNDLSKDDAEKLYAPIQAAAGDPEKTMLANREIVTRAISQVVTRDNGTRITEADAGKMRAPLANKLALKVMAFLTDGDIEKAGEKDEPANEGSEKKG